PIHQKGNCRSGQQFENRILQTFCVRPQPRARSAQSSRSGEQEPVTMQRQITALLTLAWATAALADPSPITSQATTSLLGQTNTVITTAPKPNAPMTLSGANPTARARWQQSLVLGTGDILDITMFGSNDLNRDGIVVGP